LRKERSLPILYRGNFKVSVSENLSRKVFAIDRAKPGGTNRELPRFNQTAAYFIRDIGRITREGSSFAELQWIMEQISSHYLWPCTSLGIFYRKYDTEAFKMIDAPLENIQQITAGDLAIGVKNSVTEHILRTGRATYIPDTEFDRLTQVVQLPENTLGLIRADRPFEADSLDVKENGWEFSSIIKNISPHAGCMFMMPLILDTEKIGLFAIGYERTYFWGNLLNIKEIQYHYLMGDALKLALGNLLFPVQK
jgi:hypothetical protein